MVPVLLAPMVTPTSALTDATTLLTVIPVVAVMLPLTVKLVEVLIPSVTPGPPETELLGWEA
ncbi:hypothetical protein BHD05_03720 [Marisediminicola antarctica]|uniref:Uncharacterized protein n=1 Tax=Marisediminicola antarctica TaxID=674079 RepID=A0A7L5AFW7_9MICO|nr:hypothetical protein BHD05_03720 [Marisediminicola antarctica]